MVYSEKLNKICRSPENAGSFDENLKNVGTGIVGAPSCGDVLKLQILVNDFGIVEDAKFKAFGCGAAIASSSVAALWVCGKTIEEASLVKDKEIAEHLALPPVKIHCSVLAEHAINAAINDYKKKNEEKMKEK